MLLGKPKDKFEVYNDLDDELVNLFRCVRDRPAEFLLELGLLPLNSRTEFGEWLKFHTGRRDPVLFLPTQDVILDNLLPMQQWAEQMKKALHDRADYKEVLQAAAFFKRMRNSYASSGRSFACQPFSVRTTFRQLEETSDRLSNVIVVCLFSGRFQVDTAELQRHVEANLTAADVQLLRSVEDTMAEIEFAMIDAELSSEVGAAQALYIMALYDYSSQPGFVSRLVSCFGAEQTDDQLVANVNAAFGTDIVVQDFTNVMRNVRSRRIDTTKYVDCGTKNNLDLVQWAISAYQSRWGYVMGTFGQVLTVDLLEAKLQQLPDAIGPYEDYIRANYLGVRTADCIGLIKGYSWYDPESGNINYGSNGMPDVSADQIYAQAAEKGSMATMPEIPGILVHAPGHIGIYIGNGYAIEAMGTRYGVVKTAVASRNWTGWCKNPYINYIEETEEVEGV